MGRDEDKPKPELGRLLEEGELNDEELKSLEEDPNESIESSSPLPSAAIGAAGANDLASAVVRVWLLRDDPAPQAFATDEPTEARPHTLAIVLSLGRRLPAVGFDEWPPPELAEPPPPEDKPAPALAPYVLV